MKKMLTLFMVFVLSFTSLNVKAQTLESKQGPMSIQDRLDKPDLNILDSVAIEFKDEKGSVTTEPKISGKANVKFEWSINNEDSQNIQAGDYYEFDLPQGFKVSSNLSGNLNDYASYTLTKEGKVRFTFNELISEYSDIKGNFYFTASLDEKFIKNPGEQVIKFPIKEVFEFNFNVSPNIENNNITKAGKPDKIKNPNHITWEVQINKAYSKLTEVQVIDNLPAGLTLEDIEIKPLNLDLNGNFLSYGNVLPKSDYTENGASITFKNDISKPYAIFLKTKINEDQKPNDGGSPKFINNVLMNSKDNSPLTASATITTSYGQLLSKGKPSYDPSTQTFTWTVKYNAGEKTIVNPKLVDIFNSDLEYIAGSMVIKDNKNKVYQPTITNAPKNQLDIQFNETITEELTFTYKTKVKEGKLIIENNTYENQIKTADKTAGNSGVASPQMVIKSSPAIDYNTKKISWGINVNVNGYEMKDYTLTDTYVYKGMTLDETSFVIKDVTKSTTLKKNVDFILDKTTNEGSESGFTVKFIGAYSITSSRLRVEFKTDYDFNNLIMINNTNKTFYNQVKLNWKDKDGIPHEHTSAAERSVRKETFNNGMKYGEYNAVNKEITWKVGLNYNTETLKNAKLIDKIESGQSYIPNSLIIRRYTVKSDGSINVSPTVEDLSKFTIDYPSAENGQTLTLGLPDNKNQDQFEIEFKTSLANKEIAKTYNNQAVFQNEDQITRTLDASLSINNGGTMISKKGKQDGEVIQWAIDINPSQSTIKDAIIEDIPSTNQILLRDTFVLYPVLVQPNGNYTVDKTTPLIKGVDYTLEIRIDETGAESFTLSFINTITKTYVLEYQSQISTTANNKMISNKVVISGNEVEYVNPGGTTVIEINVDSAGGGAVGVKGSFQIKKSDENGNPLAGVIFELFNKKGTKIATRITDDKGIAQFLNLIYADYKLVEVETNEGYVISDELYNGLTVKVNAESSKSTTFLNIKNTQNKLIINKKDVDGKLINGSVFRLRKLNDDKFVSRTVAVTEGTITILGLPHGTYVLEETAAPEGYIKNTQAFEFIIEANENNQAINKEIDFVNYQGTLRLTKKDALGKLLENVRYDLFTKAGVLVSSHSTNNEGIIALDKLTPGDYYLVETQSADGNIINTTPIEFNVPSAIQGKPETILKEATNSKGKVSFTKTNGETYLSGINFELYKVEDDTFKVTVSSDEQGIVSVDQLSPGNYYFVEKQSNDDYLVNTTKHSFVIPESSKTQVVHIDNLEDFVNYQGSVQLTKKDAYSGKVLKDVMYDLYYGEDTLVQENLKTDKDGMIRVDKLKPGTYHFVETKSVGGNIVNETPLSFTILQEFEGAPKLIEVSATNSKGSVQFKKVNTNGDALKDAQFKLFKKAEVKDIEITTVSSDRAGMVKVDQLEPGDYYFVEVEASSGYLINDRKIEFNMPVKAKTNNVLVDAKEFVNYKGSVVLSKQDASNQTLLDGVLFDLFNSKGERVHEGLETVEGKILVENLSPGEYYFIETASVGGNIINETPVRFTIAQSAMEEPEAVKILATNGKATVVFTKTNDKGLGMGDVKFTLYKVGSEGDDESLFADIVSNENGLVSVSNLTPGDYYFVENETTQGYLLNTRIHKFNVPERALSDALVIELNSFINYKGSVVLTKTDGTSGQTLEGVKYDLYNQLDELIKTNLKTDSNGELIVDELSPGDYYFVETSSVQGNIVNETPIRFTIQSSSLDRPAPIKISTTNSKGAVVFKKVNDSEEGLMNAVFSLHKLVDETYENVGTVTSNEEGYVRVDHLEPGQYYFQEEQATPGYLVNQEKHAFVIPVKALSSFVVVELESFINHLGSVELTKLDQEKALLQGVLFDLYDDNNALIHKDLSTNERGVISVDELSPGEYYFIETASVNGNIVNETPIYFVIAQESMGTPETVKVTATNGKGSVIFTKTNEAKHALSDTQFKLYDALGTEIASAISNIDGVVQINQLIPGIYTLEEVKAHQGYIVNTIKQTFEIPEKAFTESFVYELDDFINYKASVKVIKTDRDGRYLKEASFDLKDANGTVIQSFKTLDSVYELEDLSPGKHEIVETNAPKGYTISSAKTVFVIDSQFEGKPEMLQIMVINDRVEAGKILPGTGIEDSTVYKTSIVLMGLGLGLTLLSKKKKRMTKEI